MTADEIKTICAWCEVRMKGNKDAEHLSHGICEPCFNKEIAQQGDL